MYVDVIFIHILLGVQSNRVVIRKFYFYSTFWRVIPSTYIILEASIYVYDPTQIKDKRKEEKNVVEDVFKHLVIKMTFFSSRNNIYIFSW